VLDLERNFKLVFGPQEVFSDPDPTGSGDPDPDIQRQARESPPLTQREENLKKFHVCGHWTVWSAGGYSWNQNGFFTRIQQISDPDPEKCID
jgi:hypothetical protein